MKHEFFNSTKSNKNVIKKSDIYKEYRNAVDLFMTTDDDFISNNLDTLFQTIYSIPEKDTNLIEETKLTLPNNLRSKTMNNFNPKIELNYSSRNKIKENNTKKSYWTIMKDFEKNKETYLKSDEDNKISFINPLDNMYNKYSTTLNDYFVKNLNELKLIGMNIKEIMNKENNHYTPIPQKNKSLLKNKILEDETFNMERSAVVMRRLEYALKTKNKIEKENILENEFIDENEKQILFLLTNACVKIQKCWRLNLKIEKFKRKIKLRKIVNSLKTKIKLIKTFKSFYKLLEIKYLDNLTHAFQLIQITNIIIKPIFTKSIYFTKFLQNNLTKYIRNIQIAWKKYSQNKIIKDKIKEIKEIIYSKKLQNNWRKYRNNKMIHNNDSNREFEIITLASNFLSQPIIYKAQNKKETIN